MNDRYARNHDKYLSRYTKSKMKRIIGEKRDRISAVKKDGTEFPIELKVTGNFYYYTYCCIELNNTGEVVFIGSVKNVTHDQELLKIRDLLTNMLPMDISERIKSGENEIAEEIEGSVIFLDLCDYDKSSISGKQLVKDLNHIFKNLDAACAKFKLGMFLLQLLILAVEKLKTIGDAYMAVCSCGSKKNVFDYAIRTVEMALNVRDFMASTVYKVRIGIATGTFIQGVLSGNKLSFDVWGDSVNVASVRLNSMSNAIALATCGCAQ